MFYLVLDHKKWVKMVKVSNASYKNEIHRVDSPFKEDSKNIVFGQGNPNLGEGRAENLEEMAKNRETYCYLN